MTEYDGRRYQIMKLLGKGGFGKVYQARMFDTGGFTKEVALKLLNDVDAPEDVLQRFRDESRILGLIRDRAVISVDPPTQLDGRWAVVMEYVEGVTAGALARRQPIPPRALLQIVQEVARALDNIYRLPGPDGEPLCLVHRDIKPANLQITAHGDVKILDFGIAKAQFAERESLTTMHIMGTYGYIAPERMNGDDRPEGDIFSLGVVMRVLLSGQRMSQKHPLDLSGLQDPDSLKVLALAEDMCQSNPQKRPSPRAVEVRASALANKMQGETLREWARVQVPIRVRHREDELVGQVLHETLSNPRVAKTTSESTRNSSARLAVMTLGTAVAGVAALLLVVAVSAALVTGYRLGQTDNRTSEEATTVEPAAPPPPPKPAAGAPLPSTPEPEPVVAPEPDPPAQTARATPTPRPSPTPEPPARTHTVTLSSVPMGAEVFLDGRLLGRTPLVDVDVEEGEHTLRMVLEGDEGERQITINRRGATRFIWTVGEGWQVRF